MVDLKFGQYAGLLKTRSLCGHGVRTVLDAPGEEKMPRKAAASRTPALTRRRFEVAEFADAADGANAEELNFRSEVIGFRRLFVH